MEKNCMNHPFINAHWYCKKCNTSFCFDCIEKKHFKFSKDETFVHVCPDCKRTAEWIGINHIFNSPVKSIFKTLKYPFSKTAFQVLLLVTLLSMFFSKTLFVNEVLFLSVWVIILSYSTNVTEHILKGEVTPPKFSSIPVPALLNHIFIIFKQALIYLIFCTIFLLTKNLNSWLSFLIIPLLALPLPFIIIKIITSNTLKKLVDITSFQTVFIKSLPGYLCVSILFIPVISTFHLFLHYNPIIIIPVLCYLMIFIHKLLGEIILRCNKTLKYSIDYENFKDLYTLDSLHGFST